MSQEPEGTARARRTQPARPRSGRMAVVTAWVALAITGIAVVGLVGRSQNQTTSALRLAAALSGQEALTSGLIDQLGAEGVTVAPTTVTRLTEAHRTLAQQLDRTVDDGDVDQLGRPLGPLEQAQADQDQISMLAAANAYRDGLQTLRTRLLQDAASRSETATLQMRVGAAALVVLAAIAIAAAGRRRGAAPAASPEPVVATPPRAATTPPQADPLTGVPTRAVFRDRLEQALGAAKRTSRHVGVMFIDIDGFQEVNSEHGHDVGDQLLVEVAARLAALARETDVVARHGGDEFVVLLDHLSIVGDASEGATRMLTAFDEPFEIGGRSIRLSASAGLARSPDDGTDPAALLRMADAAIYIARRAGGGTFRAARAEQRRVDDERRQQAATLTGALDRDELVLLFQPQHDLESGRVVGFEALLRWERDSQLHPAHHFLALAERTGTADSIARWGIEAAIVQQVDWRTSDLRTVRLAINADAKLFLDPRMHDMGAILADHGLSGDSLEIEIGEEVINHPDPAIMRGIRELDALGVGIVIDRFGTQLPDMADLAHLPLRAVKLASWLLEAGNESAAQGVVGLARGLGLEVIASHIETLPQLALAKKLRADRAQGHLIAKPVTAEEAAELLGAHPR